MYKEHVITICDRHGQDGHSADEKITTVDFGLDGVDYQIDLCADEEAALRDLLQRHADAGRRKPAKRADGSDQPKRGEASKKTRERREKLKRIREWANDNPDMPNVSDHGRVPEQVIAAWERLYGNGNGGSSPDQPVQQPTEQAAAEQQIEQPAAEQAEQQQSTGGDVPAQPHGHHDQHHHAPHVPAFSAVE